MSLAHPLRDLRGFAGYLMDLGAIATNRFTNPHSYTKFLIIRAMQRRTRAATFVEAGTYYGVTADRCSGTFRRVFTIELEPALASRARAYLARRKNCTVLEGDATVVLPALLERADVDNVIISLDAHFCGEGTTCGDLPEPGVQEMAILSRFRQKIHAIVIDDFRSFGQEPSFPSKAEVLAAAEEHFGRVGYRVWVHLDQVLIERPVLT
jgi:hypothetical protein